MRRARAKIARVATKRVSTFEGKLIEGLGIGLGVGLGSFLATIAIAFMKERFPKF